ncbi:MAG: hypothetical protein IPP90_12570 [Gemmatimonadaceae bacterium]|nr:hypothetical protein [Gemmatimonadaceae bacterium]
MTEEATNGTIAKVLTLGEWHDRLGDHFAALTAQRAAGGWPVFALEHGLAEDEVVALEAAVRRELDSRSPSLRSFLPGVIYAAEFGYRYSGREYWQSFAEATPKWDDRWRNFIREAFERFARTFGGAEPDGAWAGNFTIICWPITHGVLPRDLQNQLAKILYDARFSLRPHLFETAQALGAHLRARSAGASSRFVEFAENELLLGQIAGALLVEEPETELLSTATLHRIVTDINRQRASAEWLSEARRATKAFSLRGLSSRKDASNAGRRGAAVAIARAWSNDSEVGQSRLLLRPRSVGEWDAIVEIPDLAPLARQLPHHRHALENSRARIVRARDRVVARGRLVGAGPQQVVLQQWPSPNEPLLELEGGSPELRMLLQSSFRSPAGSRHLFRVAADGIAYAKSAKTVLPGETYVLTIPEPVSHPAGGIQSVRLTCEGGYALQFTVPIVVDEVWQALLEILKLRAVQTLEVWPVGLWPVEWDGMGEATWLERDEVMIGIRSDQSIDRIRVAIGEGNVVNLDFETAEMPSRIVSLGRLPVGTYDLTLHTESSESALQPSGSMRVHVRSERLSLVARTERQAVALSTYPASPALEDLWEGKVQLQLRGPIGRRSRCKVTFLSGRPQREVFSKTLPDMLLPVEPSDWEAAFKGYVRADRKAEELIDVASKITINFDAGVLGAASLEAEREFNPIRWATSKLEGRPALKLIDDAGASDVRVDFRPVGHPVQRTQISYDVAVAGVSLRQPGGLLVASDGTRRAAAVFVPGGVVQSFEALQVHPVLGNPPYDETDLLLQASEWQDSREKGSLMAASHRQSVLKLLLAEIAGAIGGATWRRGERAWKDNETAQGMAQLMKALTDHPDERIIGDMIVQAAESWVAASPIDRITELADTLRSMRTVIGWAAYLLRSQLPASQWAPIRCTRVR